MAVVVLVVAVGLLAVTAPIAAAGGYGVFVNCASRGAYVPLVRPRTCRLLGLPRGGDDESLFTSLRWSGWGTGIAVARGRYHIRHREAVRGRLVFRTIWERVALARVRRGCDGRLYYTEVDYAEGGSAGLSSRCVQASG